MSEEQPTEASQDTNAIVLNELLSWSRANLLSLDQNTQDRLERLWCDCGYPDHVGIKTYYQLYRRNSVAKRVITAYPDACWAQPPRIYEKESPLDETPVELAYTDLNKEHDLIGNLHKVDSLSGIGQFGVLLIGVDDGKDLSEPIEGYDESETITPEGSSEHKIIYLRPLSENYVTINDYEKDQNNPRYGKPTSYSLKLTSDYGDYVDGESRTSTTDSVIVHWHRILHVTDPGDENVIFSPPRCEVVFNDIIDTVKIRGGNAEGYWQAASPILSFELQDGYDEIDSAGIKLQMESVVKGIQRYLATVGVRVNALTPEIPDPKEHFDVAITAISIATGIPKRILMGTEEGVLAGDQDGSSWADKVYGRRVNYCSKGILLPFLRKLQRMGILPAGEVYVTWENPHTVSELDQAEIAVRLTDALSKYVLSGLEQFMSFADYLHQLVGMPKHQVAEITSKIEGADEPGAITKVLDERQLRLQKESAKINAEMKPTQDEQQKQSAQAGKEEGLKSTGSSAPQIPK